MPHEEKHYALDALKDAGERAEASVSEMAALREKLDPSKVDVFRNGAQVYVVPKKLSKGNAVRRFREYIGADTVLAAGDSEFDLSMLAEADRGLAPCGFGRRFGAGFRLSEAGEGELLSEYVLSECLKHAGAGKPAADMEV